MPPNRTDVALLALIAAEPRSGYDISQAVDRQLSHFWNESFGNIYPRLKRLHESGLLTRDTQRQEGHPERHVYTITDEGREALHSWFHDAIQPQPPRNELLLKLFFGRLSPPGVLTAQLEKYRAQRAATLAQLEAIRDMLRERARSHPDLRWWLMTVGAGIHAARAAVEWADETLATLEKPEDS